jgi:hypothetical protein
MHVMIQLRPDAATELREARANKRAKLSPDTRRLLAAAAALGVQIEPVHPDQADPLLAPFYRVEVLDQETAEKVFKGFRTFDIVEAAYVKPEEQLP